MSARDTGAVKTAILKALDAYPNGATTRQIAADLQRGPDGVATRLSELEQSNRVIGVMTLQPPKRKLWFAKQYAANARVTSGDKLPKWKQGYRMPAEKTAKPAHIVAQPFVDRRYVPDKVEPYFSRPGYRTDELSTGTAIERAYK